MTDVTYLTSRELVRLVELARQVPQAPVVELIHHVVAEERLQKIRAARPLVAHTVRDDVGHVTTTYSRDAP